MGQNRTDDPLDMLGQTPTCETCGTVVDGTICQACEKAAQERRGFIKRVEP